MEEVADDRRDRQAPALVLPCHGEEFVLGAVAQLALPEARRPLRQHRRTARHRAVAALAVGRVARGDPVVDLAGRVGHPAGAVAGELHAADRRVVPQQGVAAAGGEDRDADLGVALDQVQDQALLVEAAVLVLAEAVQLLVVVGGEALLQAVVAVADRGVQARAGPPEVGAVLREELGTVLGAQEADQALGVDVDGQRAHGQLTPPVTDLDGALGGRRLVEQRARQPVQDRTAEPGTHPDRVRTPGLDTYGLLAAAPLQRAVPLAERADGGGRLREADLAAVWIFGRLIHEGCS